MLKNILLSFLFAFGALTGLDAKSGPQDPIATSQTDMNRIIQETREAVGRSSFNHPEVMKTFDALMEDWKVYYVEEKRESAQLQILLEAISFSALKHEGRSTKGKNPTPTLLHTMKTAQILWEEGNIREVHPLIVALLHDTFESSPNIYEEIQEIFGPSITRLSEEYQDTALEDKNPEEKEVSLELLSKSSLEVKLVKLAHRIDYVRTNANNNSLAWQNMRLQKFTWDIQLVNALKGANPALEAILEDAYITQLDSKPSK